MGGGECTWGGSYTGGKASSRERGSGNVPPTQGLLFCLDFICRTAWQPSLPRQNRPFLILGRVGCHPDRTKEGKTKSAGCPLAEVQPAVLSVTCLLSKSCNAKFWRRGLFPPHRHPVRLPAWRGHSSGFRSPKKCPLKIGRRNDRYMLYGFQVQKVAIATHNVIGPAGQRSVKVRLVIGVPTDSRR